MSNEVTSFVIHLLTNNSTTIDSAASELQVTSEKILEFIKQTNKSLMKGKVHEIDIEGQKVTISEETRHSLYQMLKSYKFMDITYLSPDIRKTLIIILLLTENNYYSLKDLADFVEVSKNTMLTDMKTIKEKVRNYSLTLEYSRSKGYQISGSEYKLRNLLVTELKHLLGKDFSEQLLLSEKIISKEEIFFYRKRLMEVESQLKISLTDEEFDHLPIIFSLLIKRMKAFNREWFAEAEDIVFNLTETKEYQILKKIFWNSPLSEHDRLYLVLQVFSSNLLNSGFDITISRDLTQVIEEFLDLLEGNLATKFFNRNELLKKLTTHLHPAVFRTWLNYEVRNPLADQFVDEHSSIYTIVSKSIYPIEQLIGKNFPRNEIIYVAMYIQSWIYKSEEQRDYVYKALVVCRNGTAVSKMLLETLKGMFNQVEFIGAFAERNFKNHEHTVDIIFSTVPLNTSKKTFIVNPILDKEKRTKLRSQLTAYLNRDENNKVKQLMFNLKKHIPAESYSKVEETIKDYFNGLNQNELINTQVIEEGIFPFKEQNVLFTNNEMNWEQVLDIACKPMMERKSITDAYCVKVKELFAEDGEYMRIGPSVYLPHAKPNDGVNNEDFSVVVCKKPIESPNKEELMKIIIVLAPDKENSHVPTLLFLNELFLDPLKFNMLFNALSKDEFIKLLNSFKGGELK